MSLHLRVLTFDTRDAHTLAQFWAAVLDWNVTELRGHVAVQPSAEDPWDVYLLFLDVPEGKAAKNRCHPDLHTDDLAAEIDRVVALGATLVEHHERVSLWAVLLDPEGNEFCIVQPGAGPLGAPGAP